MIERKNFFCIWKCTVRYYNFFPRFVAIWTECVELAECIKPIINTVLLFFFFFDEILFELERLFMAIFNMISVYLKYRDVGY